MGLRVLDEGADVGELEAIASDMPSNDDSAYYDAWYAHAIQRGLWVNGAKNLRQWLQKVARFTLDGRGDKVTCPVLSARSPTGIHSPSAPRRR
jgi:hypothetical protein